MASLLAGVENTNFFVSSDIFKEMYLNGNSEIIVVALINKMFHTINFCTVGKHNFLNFLAVFIPNFRNPKCIYALEMWL